MPPSKLPPSNYAAGPTPLAANHHLPYANQPFHGHAGGGAPPPGGGGGGGGMPPHQQQPRTGPLEWQLTDTMMNQPWGTVLRALNRKS